MRKEKDGETMEELEIAVKVYKECRKKRRKTIRRRVCLRTWIARLNGWTVAWYVFLTVAGVLLYKLGAAYALRERGYYAVGGEALALLLPVFYYCAAATIRDIVRDVKGRGK